MLSIFDYTTDYPTQKTKPNLMAGLLSVKILSLECHSRRKKIRCFKVHSILLSVYSH